MNPHGASWVPTCPVCGRPVGDLGRGPCPACGLPAALQSALVLARIGTTIGELKRERDELLATLRAAAPGALVANMTSAYSGIRWGTGLPRQFQYERSQSRIGGSLWDYPLRFLDNSPIFRADRVETPLLMIHNDEDDAVPWYQGIEYFLALRRLGKEAYLFTYNGEKHGLRKRINQKDYTRRLQEFFDHFLKGAPAPEWMEKGIPYLQREKEKEKYRTSEDKQ